MRPKHIKFAAVLASLTMVASSQAAITTITTDGFNTGAITDNWGATGTTTAGQWSISVTALGSDGGGGRTVAGNPFGYGGQATPQAGTGQAQFSSGYDTGNAYSSTLTDTVGHTFNVGDKVAMNFFTAGRVGGTGSITLDVSLVGAATLAFASYTPTWNNNAWVEHTTSYVTITTAGTYNVRFATAGGAGDDKTTYLDSVSYKVDAIPEPSATLLGGFGILCLLRRRRA
jgi:hypothetical protein